ncbi:LacI family DNA-binding transcriptional regulator [Psychromonas hadalis]|uniref:LacI family DNA-binding transcriptional regulator n=1 Tax=Psychromonas hadalis TaxID=211669 RepID=UPI00041E1689|nr:LacI family DNA-binding transcriptional regulator [Psychromonas hadalis]
MVTIKQVSALSGVSKSTVSRVIAHNGAVSKKSRKKVDAAILELGYRPNSFARSLKSNKSNIVGIVVVNMGSAFYAEVLGGIQKAFDGSDKHLMVSSGYGDKETEFETISSLIDRQCDGLLLFLESDFSRDEIHKLCNRDIPIVLMGRDGIPYGYNSVQVDNKTGGTVAIMSLIEAGRRKIVHLAGPQNLADARDRLDSFWQAIEQSDINKSHCCVIVGPYTEAFGYQSTKALLAEGVDFDAICAGDDEIAAGVYMALREAGKKIPEDIAVIGYDDNFHARHMYPPLTSVCQPIETLGLQAGKMLVTMMQGEQSANINMVLGATLVERESI